MPLRMAGHQHGRNGQRRVQMRIRIADGNTHRYCAEHCQRPSDRDGHPACIFRLRTCQQTAATTPLPSRIKISVPTNSPSIAACKSISQSNPALPEIARCESLKSGHAAPFPCQVLFNCSRRICDDSGADSMLARAFRNNARSRRASTSSTVRAISCGTPHTPCAV